jgi:acetamidase/formamidase
VLTIDSGDRVRYRLLDAGWNLAPPEPGGDHPPKFAGRVPELDAGHALCGPVAIRGAEPGMTLEVEIGALRTGAWGWTFAAGWETPLNRRLGVADGEMALLRWGLDPDRGVGRDQHGREVRLRPFLGVIGMPPAEPGRHPTSPPRRTGGNIDCKELVAGSRLFLPIEVAGGLVSVGDGHALQGDGEVSGMAIECPMEVAELTFRLHPGLAIARPRAETPHPEGPRTLTFGFDEDLDEAMAQALEGMLDLLEERHGLERREALALASVVVDLRITQVVNGVRGVHAVLPSGVLG